MSKIDDIIKYIFSENLKDIDYYQKKYKKQEQEVVTRVAPSPTWDLHIWSLYVSLVSQQIAKKSNWKILLRIDDTDKKRELKNAKENILKMFDYYQVYFDEWLDKFWNEIWNNWPYIQSKRIEIYKSYLKYLLKNNKAYICFTTTDELEKIKNLQKKLKTRIGYYSHWAIWRNRSLDDVLENLKLNKPFVIRLKSNWDFNNTFYYNDIVKGNIKIHENDNDIILYKQDKAVSYFLASVIDDGLMWITHVIRWDEWLPSLNVYMQLFEFFSFKKPVFAHISPIKILSWKSRVKLSKRKHKQALLSYYASEWYPVSAIKQYLMCFIKSDYQKFIKYYKNIASRDKNIKINKLKSNSGPLIDEKKIDYFSKDIIANFNKNELFEELKKYSREYDSDIFDLIKQDKNYFLNVLSIERWDNIISNPRKDLIKYSDFLNIYWYFFTWEIDYDYNLLQEYIRHTSRKQLRFSVDYFIKKYLDFLGNSKDFFNFLKDIAKKYNVDIIIFSNVVRFFITWRLKSFDLYQIIKINDKNLLEKRVESMFKFFN